MTKVSNRDQLNGLDEMENAPSTAVMYWLPIWSLTRRELVRFLRQRTRVVGALGQPLIFWVLFGAGLGGSFQAPDGIADEMTYQEYFFPGIAVLILLFTAIFSTISIIEDRREGFLQGVLVSPIPRLSLVLGKICGGTVLAVLQAVLFLVLGPVLHLVGLAPPLIIEFSVNSALLSLAWLALLAFTLTAVGYVLAWPMDSTQGFHAVMSVVLMPMWLLSGTFFPAPASGWLAWVMRINPLTYGVAGLRQVMYGRTQTEASNGLPSLGVCLTVTCLFCFVCVALAAHQTRRTSVRDVR